MKLQILDQILCQDNLVLKEVSESEAEVFHKVIQDNQNHFKKYDFISPNFKTAEETLEVIRSLISYKENLKGCSYGLWREDSLLGLFTINKINWDDSFADIGFWLVESAVGKGVASKVLKRFIEACFKEMKFKYLTATTATTNQPAQRLLKRCSFIQESILEKNITVRGHEVDELLYRIKRECGLLMELEL